MNYSVWKICEIKDAENGFNLSVEGVRMWPWWNCGAWQAVCEPGGGVIFHCITVTRGQTRAGTIHSLDLLGETKMEFKKVIYTRLPLTCAVDFTCVCWCGPTESEGGASVRGRCSEGDDDPLLLCDALKTSSSSVPVAGKKWCNSG